MCMYNVYVYPVYQILIFSASSTLIIHLFLKTNILNWRCWVDLENSRIHWPGRPSICVNISSSFWWQISRGKHQQHSVQWSIQTTKHWNDFYWVKQWISWLKAQTLPFLWRIWILLSGSFLDIHEMSSWICRILDL